MAFDDDDDSGDSRPEVDLDYLDEYDASRGTPFHHHLVAGSLAGLAEHGLMFPLDTIKTMSQCSGVCGERKPPDFFCVRAAKSLVRDGQVGAFRLWRGVGAVTAACVPAHAAYFGAFEAVRRTGGDDVFVNGLAGCVAAVGHDVIMTPADVAKQRLQLGYHRGLADCVADVARNGGFAALYRSLPTTLVMNMPYGSISVATNEYLKTTWRTKDRGEGLPVHLLLAAGGVAGSVASFATTPLDVVKTRLQTQGLAPNDTTFSRRRGVGAGDRGGAKKSLAKRLLFHDKKMIKKKQYLFDSTSVMPNRFAQDHVFPQAARHASTLEHQPPQYRGFLDAALAVWREEGPRGFLRGAPVRALAQAPSVAIVWTTYELLINLLKTK
mmetsp:Transcript_8419/g.27576  ORF Transcript_8419/g.27576 Transcript_8419/m.27576 type:complete len:381 (-) Transcript_8419:156-1298(-)